MSESGSDGHDGSSDASDPHERDGEPPRSDTHERDGEPPRSDSHEHVGEPPRSDSHERDGKPPRTKRLRHAQRALLAFLLDRSSSMAGSKWAAVHDAVNCEIAAAPDDTRFVISHFSDEVSPPTEPMDRDAALLKLASIPDPKGTTALYAAVAAVAGAVEGVLAARAHEYDPSLCVVKILTDGMDTASDDPESRAAARAAVAKCIGRDAVVTLLQVGCGKRAHETPRSPTRRSSRARRPLRSRAERARARALARAQAGHSDAARILGVPPACVLKWRDDSAHCRIALAASAEATQLHHAARLSRQPSTFGFTALHRQASSAGHADGAHVGGAPALPALARSDTLQTVLVPPNPFGLALRQVPLRRHNSFVGPPF